MLQTLTPPPPSFPKKYGVPDKIDFFFILLINIFYLPCHINCNQLSSSNKKYCTICLWNCCGIGNNILGLFKLYRGVYRYINILLFLLITRGTLNTLTISIITIRLSALLTQLYSQYLKIKLAKTMYSIHQVNQDVKILLLSNYFQVKHLDFNLLQLTSIPIKLV